LFPPVEGPSAEVLAQSGLYVALRDLKIDDKSSPWTSLAFRRFGGDIHKRTITLKSPLEEVYHVHITSKDAQTFDIDVQKKDGEILGRFTNVNASLPQPTLLQATIAQQQLRTTIVPQIEHHGAPAIASTEEKLHIFQQGQRFMLTIPSPSWLLSLQADAQKAIQGGMRAPMPSVVVDVKVNVGDVVKKGQAIIVLESMKTETVLRADADGVVKTIACAKGDMVEEGTELAMIEPTESKDA
jgi:3-methylcrotonyl-CoA carboxylase alpha subunit